MLERIIDEPRENESQPASASVYYSTHSSDNRIIVTHLSSQLSDLAYSFQEDEVFNAEFRTWDDLSDEALINFEATLD